MLQLAWLTRIRGCIASSKLSPKRLRQDSSQKKRGLTAPPLRVWKLGTQWVVANATLWNVEYSASNFFTTGMPSMNRAMILSICGYTSRL